MGLKSIPEIAGDTPYYSNTIYRIRKLNNDFPKAVATVKRGKSIMALYDSEKLIAWLEAYKAKPKPRGLVGAVVKELDSKLARQFISGGVNV